MIYAAEMLENFIGLYKLGLRDLTSPDLAPFYNGPAIPDVQVTAGLAAVQAVRMSANLPGIARDAYQEQAGPASVQFFINFLEAAGIESTFTDEITEDSASAFVPALGFRTAFVKSQEAAGRTLTTPQIRTLLRSRVIPNSQPTQHLTEPVPYVVADSDPFVGRKLTGMREYIGRYLTTQES